jgi:hypothetical protein
MVEKSLPSGSRNLTKRSSSVEPHKEVFYKSLEPYKKVFQRIFLTKQNKITS